MITVVQIFSLSLSLIRGDIDGGLLLVEDFPSLPPHTSSLMAAMQQALEGGEEGLVERVRERMRDVCGDRNTSNVMFFGHLRAGQVAQAYKILEVHTTLFLFVFR